MTIDAEVFPLPEPPPPPPAPPEFGAGKAILTFVAAMGAQFLAGIGAMIIAVMYTLAVNGPKALERPNAIDLLTKQFMPLMLLLAMLATGFAVFICARIFMWGRLREIGVAPAPLGATLGWAVAGVAMAAAYLLFAARLVPPDPNAPAGPMAQLAEEGGLARIALAIAAVLLAPPVEEFLFRGMLFRGFSKSWGNVTAAIVTTVLFVLLHLADVWHYWPAIVMIALMALLTLTARLKTGSLVPSWAAHAAYNATVMVGVYVVAP
ncbi:MAG TPA: CPBP family intramembrane glutamic endopeptidase [Thermoanaerobaculia bacterium]